MVSSLVNVVLDPLLIFAGGMGVAGAAAATCVCELVALLLYVWVMVRRGMLRLRNVLALPRWTSIRPLVVGGLAVQLRAVGFNIAFLGVTRTTQALDSSGVYAAAHTITNQLWQLGGVFLLAFSSVAAILVPAELSKSGVEPTIALTNTKLTADRMLRWGVVLGVVLSMCQLLALPLLKVFSPLPDVQDAARVPSMIGAALQVINGVVFIGEGIQQGLGGFTSLAVATVLASLGMVASLRVLGSSLTGVWASFAAFNLIRLVGVLRYHFFSGPLAPSNIRGASGGKAA